MKQLESTVVRGDCERLIELCLDSKFHRDAVSQFLVSSLELRRQLAKEFFWKLLQCARPYRLADFDSVNGAFEWVGQWLPPAEEDSKEAEELLERFMAEIRHAMTTDLDDAACLFKSALSHVRDAAAFQKLQNGTLESLREVWTCAGCGFTSLIRPRFHRALDRFIKQVAKFSAAAPPNTNHLEWMPSLVLRDLAVDRTRMGVQVFRACGKSNSPGAFDPSLLKAVFGDRWKEVLRLIAEEAPQDKNVSEDDRKIGGWVREYAAKALKDHQADGPDGHLEKSAT